MSQLINADKIIAQINKPTIVLNKFKAANIEFNYIYFKIKKRPRYCEAFLKMKKNSFFFLSNGSLPFKSDRIRNSAVINS